MTKNKAAAEVRRLILRKMSELEENTLPDYANWADLKAYIKGMAKRASAKKGGLGRK